MAEENGINPKDVLHAVFQLGIVVDDLDARIEGMKRVFGIDPVLVQECNYPDLCYKGRKIDAHSRIAKFDHFGVLLEFIEPAGEASMWSDALAASPYGALLHHIRFNDVPSNDALTAAMAQRGVSLLQEGASIVHPGNKFTFYDTEALLGFVTEVVTETPKGE